VKRKLIVVGLLGLVVTWLIYEYRHPAARRGSNQTPDQARVATQQSTVIETPEVLPVPEGRTLVPVKGMYITVRTNENTPPGERERFNAAFTREAGWGKIEVLRRSLALIATQYGRNEYELSMILLKKNGLRSDWHKPVTDLMASNRLGRFKHHPYRVQEGMLQELIDEHGEPPADWLEKRAREQEERDRRREKRRREKAETRSHGSPHDTLDL
jgi:hypothetical protein